MSREPYDPLFEMDGSLDRVADSLHSIDTSLQAIAEHLTGAQETASAPICGAQIVTREVEGMAAEIRLCERRDGPCPRSARPRHAPVADPTALPGEVTRCRP